MSTIRGGTLATPQSDEDRRTVNRDAPPKVLSVMTMAELRVLAQKLDIVRYGRMNKTQLIEAIRFIG